MMYKTLHGKPYKHKIKDKSCTSKEGGYCDCDIYETDIP